MSEIVLSDEARKAISRWTRDEFYVYIRPITSRFLDRSSKHRIYWQVSVEYRYVDFRSRRGEGYDLDEVILTLDKDVPRRKDFQPGYQGVQAKPAGKTGKKSKVERYESEAKDMTGKPREDKPKVKKKSKKKKKVPIAEVIPIDRPRKRTKEAKKKKAKQS